MPFTVLSRGVTTTALGKSFTIATIYDEVKVILHTGKVMVKANEQTRYLQPGNSWYVIRLQALFTFDNSHQQGPFFFTIAYVGNVTQTITKNTLDPRKEQSLYIVLKESSAAFST